MGALEGHPAPKQAWYVHRRSLHSCPMKEGTERHGDLPTVTQPRKLQSWELNLCHLTSSLVCCYFLSLAPALGPMEFGHTSENKIGHTHIHTAQNKLHSFTITSERAEKGKRRFYVLLQSEGKSEVPLYPEALPEGSRFTPSAQTGPASCLTYMMKSQPCRAQDWQGCVGLSGRGCCAPCPA